MEDISVGCSIFTPCFLITAICAGRDKPFIDEELGGKQRTHIRARVFIQRRLPTQKKGQCYCFCLLAVDLQRQPPLLGWRQHDHRQRQHGNNTVYFMPNTESPAVLNSLTFAGLLCLLEIIQAVFQRGAWFRQEFVTDLFDSAIGKRRWKPWKCAHKGKDVVRQVFFFFFF